MVFRLNAKYRQLECLKNSLVDKKNEQFLGDVNLPGRERLLARLDSLGVQLDKHPAEYTTAHLKRIYTQAIEADVAADVSGMSAAEKNDVISEYNAKPTVAPYSTSCGNENCKLAKLDRCNNFNKDMALALEQQYLGNRHPGFEYKLEYRDMYDSRLDLNYVDCIEHIT